MTQEEAEPRLEGISHGHLRVNEFISSFLRTKGEGSGERHWGPAGRKTEQLLHSGGSASGEQARREGGTPGSQQRKDTCWEQLGRGAGVLEPRCPEPGSGQEAGDRWTGHRGPRVLLRASVVPRLTGTQALLCLPWDKMEPGHSCPQAGWPGRSCQTWAFLVPVQRQRGIRAVGDGGAASGVGPGMRKGPGDRLAGSSHLSIQRYFCSFPPLGPLGGS